MSHLAQLVNAPPPQARVFWSFAVRKEGGEWTPVRLTRAERVLSYRNKAATRRAIADRLGREVSDVKVADKTWTYGRVPAGLCRGCWKDEGRRSLGRSIAVFSPTGNGRAGHVADHCARCSRCFSKGPNVLFL
jgi:hypothetical protein